MVPLVVLKRPGRKAEVIHLEERMSVIGVDAIGCRGG